MSVANHADPEPTTASQRATHPASTQPASTQPASTHPLAGQTALITGASRGIGEAAARAFAALGARVGVMARSKDALDRLASEINGWSLPADGTTPEGLAEGLAAFRAHAGGDPDILVTSAGVFTLSPVESTDPADLALNLSVNLTASFLAVRAVLPGMRARGSGTIVLVGSVAGRHAFPGNGAYSASKYGLRGLHEVLLEETRGSGVRITLLEPAATDTPIWDPHDPDQNPALPPRSAMLRPEEVADALSFIVTRPPGVRIPFLPIERA